MRYDYDSVADALYVTLRDEPPHRQVRLEDGTIVDVGSDDAVVGIEVLAPSRSWDPRLVADRWRLDIHERNLLGALAESFRRRPVVGAAAGGKQVPGPLRPAA
jgi:uncharacterized protein YuzE